MKLKENFLWLKHRDKEKMIQIGIWKHPRLYRRSRKGVNLFHKIKTVIHRLRKWYRQAQMNSTCGNTNIITVELTPKETHKMSDWLHYGLGNCHPVVNKTQSIKVEINNNNLDLCVLMETWLKPDDMLTAHQIFLIGYKAICILRTGRTGGGIVLVHRADNNIKLDKIHTKSKMEGVTFMYHCPSYNHHLTVVYRPPDTSVVQFTSDLTDALEEYVNQHGHHTILGDFSVWINDKNDSDMINFSDFLNTFDLTNKVQFSINKQHQHHWLHYNTKEIKLHPECKTRESFLRPL